MDGERLEWALRRLPGVLACSLDGDTVTLLVDPHAPALDVEAAANALLLGAGDVRPPVVLGGTRPLIVPSRSRFDVMPVVKAAGPGLLAVGAVALVTTLVASPAAFWRDSVTPSAAPPVATAPSASPRRGGHTESPDRPTVPNAELAAPTAAAPPQVTDRRLVLLVPQLPSAPIQNIAAVTAAPAVVADKVGASDAGGSSPDKGTAPVPSPPVAPPAPIQEPRSGVRENDGESEREDRGEERREGKHRNGKHGGKHGEKDAQGHGEKGWGKTRREQVRPQKARGHERSSASARGQRRGRDDD